MLFGETVAVYCENPMEHADTLCGQNAEFLHNCIHKSSSYLTGNTFRLHYKAQYCLGKQSLFIVRTIRNTQIHCVSRMQGFGVLKQVVHIVATEL
jgi:hypothetical protein